MARLYGLIRVWNYAALEKLMSFINYVRTKYSIFMYTPLAMSHKNVIVNSTCWWYIFLYREYDFKFMEQFISVAGENLGVFQFLEFILVDDLITEILQSSTDWLNDIQLCNFQDQLVRLR